ncbi:MAG: hypothetical protein WBW04_20280 [Nitrolancea sp.]
MRRVKTRKPWKCDECGREFEAGSEAYVGRYGVWLVVDGLRVHAETEGRVCRSCVDYQPILGSQP